MTKSTALTATIKQHPIVTSDGIRLHSRWQTIPNARATIVIVHGLGEHGGRYDHVAEHFLNHQYSVVRYDMRGHGLSDGQRGYFNSFKEVLDGVTQVLTRVNQELPDSPVVLYGHSLGGGIVANWLLHHDWTQHQVFAAILSAPWLTLSSPPSAFYVLLIRLLSMIAPKASIPTNLRVGELCREPHAIEEYNRDEYVHGRLTFRLAIEAYDAGHWNIKNAERCDLPIFAFHGLSDTVTDPASTKQFCDKAPRATYTEYPDMLHEPHNDQRQKELLASITNWLSTLEAKTGESPAGRL